MRAVKIALASLAGPLGRRRKHHRGGIFGVNVPAAEAVGGKWAICTPACLQPGQCGPQCVLCGSGADGSILCSKCGRVAAVLGAR
jgi:hypothetical protein